MEALARLRALALACLKLGWVVAYAIRVRISQVPMPYSLAPIIPCVVILHWCIANTLHAVLFIVVVSSACFFVQN